MVFDKKIRNIIVYMILTGVENGLAFYFLINVIKLNKIIDNKNYLYKN